MIEIFEATLNDLEQIQKLNLMLFQKEQKEYDIALNVDWTMSNLGHDYFQKSINNDNACTLIAKSGDEIIGYLICWISSKENKCRNKGISATLENMYVLEEYRNKKVGTKLIEYLKDWLKRKGINNLSVSAHIENQRGINFYEKLGFKGHILKLELDF